MSNLNLLPDDVVDQDGNRWLYGKQWKPWKFGEVVIPCPIWSIEKDCYWHLTNGRPTAPGVIDRKEHFMRFVNAIWGREDSIWPWQWNPNAVKILEKKLEYRILMIAGPSG